MSKLQLHFGKAKKANGAKSANLLFGTGFTKRLAEKAQRQQQQVAAIDSEADSRNDIDEPSQANQPTATINAAPLLSPTYTDTNILPDNLLASDITLDEYQQAAKVGIAGQKFAVLIGSAGTGKTTTVKQLVAEVEKSVGLIDMNKARTKSNQTQTEDLNVAICFCSFTGKAVQQIKRALPKEYHPLCNTIHSTLGYAPTTEDVYDTALERWVAKRVFRPQFTEHNKLPYQIVIIDESGTVPTGLFNELVAALPDSVRIIMIGDINQLPPVIGRSVLGFAMLKWPTWTLEKIHRQAKDNPIIYNAHRILAGFKPVKKPGFAILEIADGSVSAARECNGIIQQLHKADHFDPLQDAFIVPQNKGNLGQIALNEQLVRYFNPTTTDEDGVLINPRQVIQAGYIQVMFAVGDKVMLLANDNQRGLTNGMIGIVTAINQNSKFRGDAISHDLHKKFSGGIDLGDLNEAIDAEMAKEATEDESESQRQASHVMEVTLQGVKRPTTFETAGAYRQIAHAYAFTCHKSQGSEFRNVVILCHASTLRMLTREWLYTAVTRAKEKVVLLINNRGLTHAINSQVIKGKTVAEKAQQFLAIQNAGDNEALPNLAEPEEIN